LTFTHITRFGFTAITSFVLAAALASCLDGQIDGQSNSGGLGNAGASGSANGVGGSANGVGGTATSSGGTDPGSGGTDSGSGGTGTSAGGTSSSGGTVGSGGTSTGSGGTGQTCSNVQHPDHLDKPCSIWAEWDATKGPSEPKDCDSSWLTGSGYCLESCGKCSSGGSGGSTSSGGSTGSGGSSAGSGGSGLGGGPNLPNITGGQVYWASRYWDCCKPHCANFGMPSCGANGVSSNTGQSACSGGSAYACYNEAPRAVGTNVSYGYIAVPNPSCGTCYHLQFTGNGQHNANDPGSQQIAGKHMIVKVTNTGGDVAGNQFDLMIPGGGVGQNPNTCPQQWGVSSGELGPMYGGFLSACSGTHAEKKNCVRQKCNLLPAGDLRDGCYWFVDWFQVADNPQFRYESIACPSDI
jgi:hypothetical protein